MAEQLPWEHEFGEAEGRRWCEKMGLTWIAHGFHLELACVYIYRYEGMRTDSSKPAGRSSTGRLSDKHWREAIADYCDNAKLDLPWRTMPDLSTVAGCLDALRAAGREVLLRPGRGSPSVMHPITVGPPGCADGAWQTYGEPGSGWTPELLQQATRDALGLPADA